MSGSLTSYRDVMQGVAFSQIDKDTIPPEIWPKDPGPILAWATGAEQNVIRLAEDVAYSALMSLPDFFSCEFRISGIRAQDLFSLNTLMGSTIKDYVVHELNRRRNDTWDRDGIWSEYSFVRSAQTFPDVRLVKYTDPSDIRIGIELKSC